MRKAKVGGYRDYFTDEQCAQLDAMVRSWIRYSATGRTGMNLAIQNLRQGLQTARKKLSRKWLHWRMRGESEAVHS